MASSAQAMAVRKRAAKSSRAWRRAFRSPPRHRPRQRLGRRALSTPRTPGRRCAGCCAPSVRATSRQRDPRLTRPWQQGAVPCTRVWPDGWRLSRYRRGCTSKADDGGLDSPLTRRPLVTAASARTISYGALRGVRSRPVRPAYTDTVPRARAMSSQSGPGDLHGPPRQIVGPPGVLNGTAPSPGPGSRRRPPRARPASRRRSAGKPGAVLRLSPSRSQPLTCALVRSSNT